MRSVFYEKENEATIILFVLIPECGACRKRIEKNLLQIGNWKRVVIGYPRDDGSELYLVHEKNDEVDYWESAKVARLWLNRHGYRVM